MHPPLQADSKNISGICYSSATLFPSQRPAHRAITAHVQGTGPHLLPCQNTALKQESPLRKYCINTLGYFRILVNLLFLTETEVSQRTVYNTKLDLLFLPQTHKGPGEFWNSESNSLLFSHQTFR